MADYTYRSNVMETGDSKMQNDPIKNFYIKGYEDAKAGRKARGIPQNFKLAYVSGRYDAATNKLSRYEVG